MFDVIVVGGGPAGLSGALMLGRCRRRVLLCDRGEPRNRRSRALHGYLTREGTAPAAFLDIGRTEAAAYGIEMRTTGVTSARWSGDRFSVTLDDGRKESARYILIATGVVDEVPAIPGIDACYGRSVFHCPYCDGWEWRDRRIAALGGHDRQGGAGLALGLVTWSRDVVFCTNGKRIDRRTSGRLDRNGVLVRTEPIASVEHADGELRAITFASGDRLERDALFFASGQHQRCDIAVRLGCAFNRRGTVKTGTLSDTNVPHVYVAGDASRDAQFVVVAAAEGVKAAVAINKELQREGLVS